jgi:hypothetical protein
MNNMKRKLISYVIIILILIGNLTMVDATKENNSSIVSAKKPTDIHEIRVAIYTDEKEDAQFYGPYGRTRYFVWALNYSWQVGNIVYHFNTTLLPTKNLMKGDLTKENYDVLIYPPDTYDEYAFPRALKFLPKNRIIARQIKNFVENGGGYYGSCGGALIAGDMLNKPNTFFERAIKNGMLGISCIDVYFDGSIPLLCQFVGESPDSVGPTPVHLIYSGFNQTDYNVNYHSGICLDLPIFKDNPIFDDFLQDTRRVRWLGAPNYVIPENPDRTIYVLATFPAEDMSNNVSTQNHYWRYTGGVRGLMKGALKGILGQGTVHYWDNLGFSMSMYTLAGDWEMQDTLLITNFSNRPFWTAEIYPNENGARIIRCTGHPEHNVWWGGYIEDAEDTDNNNLFEGLYYWKDIIPENETIEDEFSYNYWTIRRCIAWAAQIPDGDIPSTYGSSEVKDVLPYNQSSTITVYGNAEKISKGIASLKLYYRFSNNNNTWGHWKVYETDRNAFDGWLWDFDSSKANGAGFYQFYSQKCVHYEFEWMNETAPPSPDTIVRVS